MSSVRKTETSWRCEEANKSIIRDTYRHLHRYTGLKVITDNATIKFGDFKCIKELLRY